MDKLILSCYRPFEIIFPQTLSFNAWHRMHFKNHAENFLLSHDLRIRSMVIRFLENDTIPSVATKPEWPVLILSRNQSCELYITGAPVSIMTENFIGVQLEPVYKTVKSVSQKSAEGHSKLYKLSKKMAYNSIAIDIQSEHLTSTALELMGIKAIDFVEQGRKIGETLKAFK